MAKLDPHQFTKYPIPPLKSTKGKTTIPIYECGEPLVELRNSETILIEPVYYNRQLNGAIQAIYLRETLVKKLLQVAQFLPNGYQLKILDGWRPIEVQQALFNEFYEHLQQKYPTLSHQDLQLKTQDFVSLPSTDATKPSNHLTGGSVDLTIVDEQGQALNMGTPFDDFTTLAHTRHFEEQQQKATLQILKNRRLLFHAMINEGFTNYPLEWWHFDYGNQNWAKINDCQAIYGKISPF